MANHSISVEPLPGKGQPIQLVRWIRGRDGWEHEILRGRYISCTTSVIRVERGGETISLDRGTWSVILSEGPIVPAAEL